MKHWLFLFLLIAPLANAQNDSLFEACRMRDTIWFTENLQPVFAKLQQAKAGSPTVTKIVQIGDSHVQMGYFSNAVGQELNALYGNVASNSFWFPYATVNGYNPVGVHFSWEGPWKGEKMVGSQNEKRFGISGHAFVLTAKGETQPHFTVGTEVLLQKLEILVETNATWRFCVDSAVVKSKNISQHLTLVTIERQQAVHQLKVSMCPVGKGEPQPLRILGFRNAAQAVKSGIDFQFYGSSGGKYSDYISGADYFFENLEYLDPDLLIISLGTNDTYVHGLTSETYHAMVLGFIATLRVQHPDMQILLTMPPDTYFKQNKPASAPIVFQSLFRVAQEQRCSLWNFAEVMGGENSIQSWFIAGLSNPDLMHFNPQGYQLQGRLLVEALNNAYLKYHK